MKLLKQLYIQILIGIFLGIILGLISPESAEAMKPFGDAFIKLIKMLIAPIIFCTLVTGIVYMGDMKKAATLGFKAIIYFEILTTFALIIGLIIGNVTDLGRGMNIDPATLDASSVSSYAAKASDASAHPHTFANFAMDLIPESFFSGVVQGNLLQTLFVAILFAWAMLGMGKRAAPVVELIDSMSHAFFRMVGIVMWLAPVGAFGAMAFTVGKYGVNALGPLIGFVLLFYASCLIFIVVVLGSFLKFTTGLSIFKVISYIKDELIVVFGTASSETVLPRMLDKLERLGIERQVVGMVLPTGYSFNLDGSSMFFTIAILFLAHATGIDLSLGQQISILLILLFTSKGAAAVVGSAFIVLTGTLATINIIPVASVALILGIDRFMAVGRAMTNLVGNTVATIIIAKWEKAVDLNYSRDVLDGKIITKGDTDVERIVTAGNEITEPLS